MKEPLPAETTEKTGALALERDGGRATIRFCRPPVNVLDLEALDHLGAILRDLSEDRNLKVLLFEGEGRCFSAGVEVADHLPDRAKGMLTTFHEVCRILLAFPIPTVAKVHGMALGGGLELAVACDLTLVADDARLAQPEIQLAAIPTLAAAYYPEVVGRKRALDLVLTGRDLTPGEALSLGLVNRVVPPGKLDEAAHGMVDRFLNMSRPALIACKKALDHGSRWKPDVALWAIQELYLEELLPTEDAREGLEAFLNKRAPIWRDR